MGRNSARTTAPEAKHASQDNDQIGFKLQFASPRFTTRASPHVPHGFVEHARLHVTQAIHLIRSLVRRASDFSSHRLAYFTLNVGSAPPFSMKVHLPSAHTRFSISMRLSCTYCSAESPSACR